MRAAVGGVNSTLIKVPRELRGLVSHLGVFNDMNEGLKSQFGLGTTPTVEEVDVPDQTLQSRKVQINVAYDKVASGTTKVMIDGGTAPCAPTLTLP